MDINAIREKKRELETTIRTEIEKFEKETSLKLTGLTMGRVAVDRRLASDSGERITVYTTVNF